MSFKENKGVSLMSLVITVIILLIISGAIIFNTKNQFSMRQINALRNDIELLNQKVEDYYIKYGELPILCDYTTPEATNLKNKIDFQDLIYRNAENKGATVNNDVNENDGDEYVVIDLEKLGGFTLNFGYDKDGEYFELKENPDILYSETIQDEIYVINTTTHQIYFPHGIFVDNIMYYCIDTNMNKVEVDTSTDLKASNLKNKDVDFYEDFYGVTVTNYTSENGFNQWKIFYADEEHFYLIASDYIAYNANLKGKGGTGHSFLQGTTSYNYKFGTSALDGVMQDYPNGTGELKDTTYATAKEIKALNSKYFSEYPSKQTEPNKIAVASMLDTTVWKGYMDKSDKTGKAQFAIGGPTIEMLFNSYNQKYNLFNENNKGKYQVDVPSEDNDGVGYKISADYGETWSAYILNAIATNDSLYTNQPGIYTNAHGYRISSYSAGTNNDVMYVAPSGYIGSVSYNWEHAGFRPLVCLKSDTVLHQVGENEYRIVN